MTLADLIRRAKLDTPEKVEEFHFQRKAAFRLAEVVYEDRAESYNKDHEPTEEMVFGPLSLASEIFKRARRTCGLLSPLRESELRQADLDRLVDTTIDQLNYNSWLYALLIRAGAEPNHLCSEAKEVADAANGRRHTT